MVREAYYIKGEGVCEYEIDEKSGGSEAWMVIREEGNLCLCYSHLAREAYRSMCAVKKELGVLHTPWVNDLK